MSHLQELQRGKCQMRILPWWKLSVARTSLKKYGAFCDDNRFSCLFCNHSGLGRPSVVFNVTKWIWMTKTIIFTAETLSVSSTFLLLKHIIHINILVCFCDSLGSHVFYLLLFGLYKDTKTPVCIKRTEIIYIYISAVVATIHQGVSKPPIQWQEWPQPQLFF